MLRIPRMTTLLFSLLLAAITPPCSAAETLLIAAGAGYKKPLTEICHDFTKRTGIKTEQIYGNMGVITSQAKANPQIALVVGDQDYLEKKSPLTFTSFLALGTGKLVLAWSKYQSLKQPEELVDARFQKIAYPNAHSAIYGIAASAYLKQAATGNAIKPKLIETSTVPQVSAYLISGEVDAGFMNLTQALAVQDRIGGFLEIPQAEYPTIKIVAGVLPGHENTSSIQQFSQYLNTPSARGILHTHGL